MSVGVLVDGELLRLAGSRHGDEYRCTLHRTVLRARVSVSILLLLVIIIGESDWFRNHSRNHFELMNFILKS